MYNCSNCHQAITNVESRCPHCGSLNSKIDDILAKEAAEREKNSFKGQLKSIIQADDRKQAFLERLQGVKQSLTKEILFTLFVIFAFIFTMTLTVL